MKKTILPILLAAAWVSISEFVRNQFILQSYWIEHYGKLGQVFPAAPVNGAVWGLWSIGYAAVIYFIARKYSLWPTVLLAWFIGFGLMWLVIGNLNVLPFGILPAAIPLSLLEAFVATWIITRFIEVPKA